MKAIYKLTNKINNKFYIGKTTQTLEKRFREHIYNARIWEKDEQSGKPHKRKSRLYPAMNKYGYENFELSLVETLEEDADIDAVEQAWIERLDATNDKIGYNISPGGLGGPLFAGHHHSLETKKKLSAISKGIKQDPEFVKYRTRNTPKVPVQNLLTGEYFNSLKEAGIKNSLEWKVFNGYKYSSYYGNYWLRIAADQHPLALGECVALLSDIHRYHNQRREEQRKIAATTLQQVNADPEVQARRKKAHAEAASLRRKRYWSSFMLENNIDEELYKIIYQQYKNNCPNKHLELYFKIKYEQVRNLNKYLGLIGGGDNGNT